jgi:hypothetical protein
MEGSVRTARDRLATSVISGVIEPGIAIAEVGAMRDRSA